MKILLDECVTKHLKPHLSNFEVFTVTELKWNGIKNGRLMSMCAEHHFDILLTIDKSLQFQQNLDKFPLTVVIFNSISSSIDELVKFLPAFQVRAENFEKHKAYIIEKAE